jgi:hypothetical protein
MSYFRELPDLYYQSPLSSRNSSTDYIRVKNLFRRVKLRDDLQNVFTLFNKYEIPEGARPDTVAEELYGSPELDWVVLLSAGIVNVIDQWPLSNSDLYQYAENKYGDELTAIRFYETTEVKDSNGRLILPEGKVVPSDFKIPNPSNVKVDLNPVTGISNYEYEVRKNEDKRLIYTLKPDYLQAYIGDLRRIMHYEKSSQYINKRLAATENTRNTSPQ